MELFHACQGILALDHTDGGLTDHESSTREEIFRAHRRICNLINFIPKEAPVHVDTPIASKVHTEIKLPKFRVLTFDGNIMNWSNFWDQFSVSIHDKTELSDTAKLAYLRNAMKDGPADAVISGLAKTGDTYDEAVDCLRKRYDRPRVIHQAHVDAITRTERWQTQGYA